MGSRTPVWPTRVNRNQNRTATRSTSATDYSYTHAPGPTAVFCVMIDKANKVLFAEFFLCLLLVFNFATGQYLDLALGSWSGNILPSTSRRGFLLSRNDNG